MNLNKTTVKKILAIISIITGWLCFWFVDGTISWLFKQAFGFLLVGTGLLFLIKQKKFKLKKIMILLLAVPSLFFMVNSVTPNPLLATLKNTIPGIKPAQQNVWQADYAESNEQGQRLLSNIQYGDKFPNSFLDIYFPANYDKKLGIIVYFHGGGYMWGDKTTGDPNTGQDKDLVLEKFLQSGYAVAQVNYALTPDYSFPTPAKQANEAVKYLAAHANQYNINMERVIIGGGSAGTNIAGNLVNIITNSDYAQLLKETPGIDKEKLVAFISLSGLLDNSRFGHTEGSRLISYIFYQMGRVYTNTNDLKANSKAISNSNVIKWATEAFPPTFVSDGNTGTFTDQAIDLHQKLDKLGIKNQLSTYPKSVAELTHGYETQGNKEGNETLEKMMSFLKDVGK